MPSKRRLDQLKSARAAAVQACKKRKAETSSVLNVPHEIEDDKLDTTDTSDTEAKLQPGSGKKAEIRVTRTLKREKVKTKRRKAILEVEESRANKAVSPEVSKRR